MVRQLTAIMFTDMVGYTALMQENEHRAKANRDRHREVLERQIPEHGGRILQFYGDGTLSVFQSAVSAVESAMEIQGELRDSDAPIPLRIGIHSGDVVHDDEGVFGDGVNVASRIEGLGVPGSVLISGKVYDEVKNQPNIRTRGLGSFNLKNVKHPTRVYAVANSGLEVPTELEVQPARATETRSIAVLPFVNMSSDPENEFFSDGMTEEIINALTRVNGLQVTARTSSFAFKNHNEDIRAIAEKLSVTHILEGSVRKAGNQVRVTSQLISAEDGYHLMSEAYDGSLDDIFSLQDEISRRIVEHLADHLGPVPTSGDTAADDALVHAHSHDTEAYAEYLRGRFAWGRWTPDGARDAIDHYCRSIQLDPDCGLPYSGLAGSYTFLGATGAMPADEAFTKAEEAAAKAIDLEDTAGEAHMAMGLVRLFRYWDWEGSYASLQKALSLNPGSAETHHMYGMYLKALGDVDAALDEFEAALQLDPLSSPIRLSHAEAVMVAGDMTAARKALEAIVEEDPDFRAAVEALGMACLKMGDPERAIELFERLPVLADRPYAGAAVRGLAYGLLGRYEEAHEMLGLLHQRADEEPGVALAVDLALVYQGLGDLDKMFEYLERGVEDKLGMAVFLYVNPIWADVARDDPRFEDLLRRIGHPKALVTRTE